MPTWPAVLLSSNLILVVFFIISICHHKLNKFLNVSPQTMVLCTTWSKAFQSRCPHLLVAYCCHIPHHHGSGPFHPWCRHTAPSFSSHRVRMLCCTGRQKTMITEEILTNRYFPQHTHNPHPLPVLSQPMWRAFIVSAGVNGQRFVFRWALRLRYHSSLWCFAVHMTHCFSMPTDAWTLSRNGNVF